MSNRAIAIMVLVLIAATGYLLVMGDGDIDMGGEKHGAEALHVEDKKPAASTPSASAASASPAAPAAEAVKK